MEVSEIVENTIVSQKVRFAKERLYLYKSSDVARVKEWYEFVQAEWRPAYEELMSNDDQIRSGLLMIMGFLTQDTRHIRPFTGWDHKWLRERAVRARKNGIWLGCNMIGSKWYREFDSLSDHELTVCLVLDAMVINGDVTQKRGIYRAV
jgi:hypothetical protein